MIRKLLLLLFSSVSFASISQDSVSVRYMNQFLVGGLHGKDKGVAFSACTVHGVDWKQVSLGAGIGIDDYESDQWRAMPVFLSFRWNVPSGSNRSLFFELNAGKSKLWHVHQYYEPYAYNIKRSGMVNPAIGLKISYDKVDVFLKLGYKYQTIHFVRSASQWTVDSVIQDINRIEFQIGFGFR
jgi:hypothetical protein